MMIEIWEEFEEDIKFYQISFSITIIIGLITVYFCT